MKASLQLQPMYCSRDYIYSSRFNQQYEKPTQQEGMFFSCGEIHVFIGNISQQALWVLMSYGSAILCVAVYITDKG